MSLDADNTSQEVPHPAQSEYLFTYNAFALVPCLSDWVRDVAWAPSTAMPFNIVASCSEDCCVYIWKQTEVRCSPKRSTHSLQYHAFIISAVSSGWSVLNSIFEVHGSLYSLPSSVDLKSNSHPDSLLYSFF